MLGLTFMLVWFFGMVVYVIVRALILVFTGIEYLVKGVRYIYVQLFKSKNATKPIQTTQID